ncbi:MAG: gamma-glutamyltransferase [Rhodospirillales bacterium]|nr:gamma-glutamyltransferase [Rhodospirillales bacterium]
MAIRHADRTTRQRGMHGMLARSGGRVALALALICSGCSDSGGSGGSFWNMFGSNAPPPGTPGFVKGFLGGVVADEPRAALVGREVLSSGGNAADAAVAVAFALSVTLPSRAGLGGGGACLAYSPDAKSVNGGTPEAVLFTPMAPAGGGGPADRPAAVPMLARGMFLLNARYGTRPIEVPIAKAEELARFGVLTSRALARDVAVVAGPLFTDPGARAVFSRDGQPIAEGQQLVQTELAATLAQLRVSGVGDLYQGGLARRLIDASPLIGGPLQAADLRAGLPKLSAPLVIDARRDKIAFLPPPADGGLGAAVAFQALQAAPNDVENATARALAAVASYRAGGISPAAILAGQPLTAAAMPPLPASTTFATLDKSGNAVVCALTMDNLFGTGRIFPGTGMVAAASPNSVPPPLLAAALAWNDRIHAFRAEVGGTGQDGAATAAAVGMANTLRSNVPMPAPVPDPGRANVIACSGYLPPNTDSCGWAVDPRDSGMAAGGT